MPMEMFLLLLQSVALSYFDYLEASVMDVDIFSSTTQFASYYLEYSEASQCFSRSPPHSANNLMRLGNPRERPSTSQTLLTSSQQRLRRCP